MFSFILGDLHPHVMALPFVLLAVGVALALFRSREPLDIAFWIQRPLALLAAAVVLGALAFINTWDIATLAFVVVAAAAISNFMRVRKLTLDLVVQVVSFALPLVVLAVVLVPPVLRRASRRRPMASAPSSRTGASPSPARARCTRCCSGDRCSPSCCRSSRAPARRARAHHRDARRARVRAVAARAARLGARLRLRGGRRQRQAQRRRRPGHADRRSRQRLVYGHLLRRRARGVAARALARGDVLRRSRRARERRLHARHHLDGAAARARLRVLLRRRRVQLAHEHGLQALLPGMAAARGRRRIRTLLSRDALAPDVPARERLPLRLGHARRRLHRRRRDVHLRRHHGPHPPVRR